VTYIPPIALKLKTFSSVEEMNEHMNLQFLLIKSKLTKSYDVIFHLIKKYACKVAGVCWLKQEKLAELASVSVKTVERGLHFLKENGVVKIYHTKRSNGLNGHSYYVLQRFEGELPLDDEVIVGVEEINVGAVDVVGDYETVGFEEGNVEDKRPLSSYKALESSFETKEENIYKPAREKFKIYSNAIKEDHCQELVGYLVHNGFSREAASEITERVLEKNEGIIASVIMKAYLGALRKFRERLVYQKPVYSVVDYVVKLVQDEIRPGYVGVKREDRKRSGGESYAAKAFLSEVGDWLKGF
jgi:CRISPR/Cas system CSM-associated protein Csm2 small subunit